MRNLRYNRKKLIIVGAGGFGREVLNWSKDVERDQEEWNIIGFLDSNPQALEGYPSYPPILGDPMKYEPHDNEIFVCAIAKPDLRIEICNRLKAAGATFITLIHNTAVVSQHTTIENGCVICPRAVIMANAHIGNHVIVNVAATVGHDAVIDDWCTLNGHSDVTGFARLGKGVVLGSHAVILQNATIGDGVTVCAGSVVLRRAKAGSTVMGIPAIEAGGFKSLHQNRTIR